MKDKDGITPVSDPILVQSNKETAHKSKGILVAMTTLSCLGHVFILEASGTMSQCDKTKSIPLYPLSVF